MAAMTERIQILDIVRGIAVLGIFAINIQDMSFPEELAFRADVYYDASAVNYWISIVMETIFYGKMRALFALLFGVSSVLIIENALSKMEGINPVKIYFMRLFWLAVIGLMHAFFLLWWGEVLFKYAVLGTLLFAFRRANFTVLFSGMLICLTILTLQPTLRYLELDSSNYWLFRPDLAVPAPAAA